MANVNKSKQGRYYRALTYLQGAVGHADIAYTRQVKSVVSAETWAVYPVGEMSNAGGAVAYQLAVLPDGRPLWVGVELTDKPGDVYVYHAWVLDEQGQLAPGSIQHAPTENQQRFVATLRKALDGARPHREI